MYVCGCGGKFSLKVACRGAPIDSLVCVSMYTEVNAALLCNFSRGPIIMCPHNQFQMPPLPCHNNVILTTKHSTVQATNPGQHSVLEQHGSHC